MLDEWGLILTSVGDNVTERRSSDEKSKILICCATLVHTAPPLQLFLTTGQRLKWILLCGDDPTQPPDFWFDDPDFQPSLAGVDAAPGPALSRVLVEYRTFQHRLVAKHPSPLIQYEYESTIGKPDQFGHVAIDVVRTVLLSCLVDC
jgi:hypothetical protein